jgi:hypothetical protein
VKMNWKRNAAAIIVSAVVLVSAQPAAVIASEGLSAAAEEVSYSLTDSIKARVKSVAYERSGDGSRIGTLIRLTNNGSRIARIPDYELRIQASDGTEYVLSESTANAKAIQPKETVELSYMAQVDTSESIGIASLAWVEIDEYVYPKLETEKLSIPVASIVWQDDGPAGGTGVALKQWGEAFTIPQISGVLAFTGVLVSEEYTAEGPVSIVTLAAKNQGALNQVVPEFRLDGKGEQKLYRGSRIEKDELILGPGETGYIHFAIPREPEIRLKGFILQTEEIFIGSNQKMTPYSVGWVELAPPEAEDAKAYIAGLAPYRHHDPILFDPVNKLVPKDVDVSLEQLHLLESSEGGYKAVHAKFKLTNKQSYPVPLPDFQADLLTADGNRYAGIRAGNPPRNLLPRLSYMVEYTFVLPDADEAGELAMRLSDSLTLKPYSIPIAEFRTKVLHEHEETAVSIYPYELKFGGWSVRTSSLLVGTEIRYSQEIKLVLKAERSDKVLYDPSQGNLRVELVRKDGSRLGSQLLPLKQDPWALTEERTLLFSDTGDNGGGYLLHIYESIATPFGTAERLVKTLKE